MSLALPMILVSSLAVGLAVGLGYRLAFELLDAVSRAPRSRT